MEILVLGAGEHSRVVIDAIEKQGAHEIVGVIDPRLKVGTSVLGYPVLGTEDDLPRLGFRAGLVAINDNFRRHAVVQKVLSLVPDFQFVSAIHPSAILGRDVTIGAGSMVLAGTNLSTGVILGEHVVVNSRASVDHDTVLEAFTSVGPGAILAGNILVKRGAVIALGAKIIQRIEIGEHALVGAGALVVRNIPAEVVAFGTPAKVQRNRVPGEKYL